MDKSKIAIILVGLFIWVGGTQKWFSMGWIDLVALCLVCGLYLSNRSLRERVRTLSSKDPADPETMRSDILQEVKELLMAGKKINAIKLVLDSTSLNLGSAKNFVDKLEKNIHSLDS